MESNTQLSQKTFLGHPCLHHHAPRKELMKRISMQFGLEQRLDLIINSPFEGDYMRMASFLAKKILKYLLY